MSELPDICDKLSTPKKALCRNIIEAHARNEFSTRETEKKLSELAGEDVVMSAPPKGLGYETGEKGRQEMESWAKGLCEALNKSAEAASACLRELDGFFTLGGDFDSIIKKIATMAQRNDDEVEKLIVDTCPCMK